KFLGKNMEGLNLLNNAAHMKELAKEAGSHSAAVREQARASLILAEASRPLQMAFQQLGVSIYESNGQLRGESDVMMQVADAFKKMPDGAEKAGLAMKLFGKSGADLIPL